MTPRDLIDQARADGVEMALTAAGRLRLIGNQVDIDRWLPVVGQYGDQIVAELRTASAPG